MLRRGKSGYSKEARTLKRTLVCVCWGDYICGAYAYGVSHMYTRTHIRAGYWVSSLSFLALFP